MINKKFFEYKIPILIIFMFIIFTFLFGSALPRFLFEGYIWLVYLVSKNFKKTSLSFKIFSKLIYFQMIIIIPVYLLYIINLFPGSINQELKDLVLKKNANGYELAKWTNKNLDEKDVLLSTHRSVTLFEKQTLSTIFTWYVDLNDPRSMDYIKYLKLKKINKVVFYGNKLDKNIFKNCLGKELFYKKDVGRHVGRNPFSKKEYYNGWIYEFDYLSLPGCLF